MTIKKRGGVCQQILTYTCSGNQTFRILTDIVDISTANVTTSLGHGGGPTCPDTSPCFVTSEIRTSLIPSKIRTESKSYMLKCGHLTNYISFSFR